LIPPTTGRDSMRDCGGTRGLLAATASFEVALFSPCKYVSAVVVGTHFNPVLHQDWREED
jgi:hypothetical protein